MPNRIKYNNVWFEESDIQSAEVVRTKSMVSEECGINTFSAVIYSEDIGENPLLTLFGDEYAPDGYDAYVVQSEWNIMDYTPFSPVEFWKDGVMMGKYYLTSIERVSRNWFKLDACSPIGILDRLTHRGGLYNQKTFAALAGEIIGNAITYSIDPSIANLPINGWLPYGSARENLNQLLFSVGAAATYSAAGNMLFKYNEPDVSVDISDSEIYLGGSVDYPVKASRVTLIEHAWFEDNTVESEVLFDNTGGTSVNNSLVVFDKPYHSLSGSGLSVTPVNANCCYVSGVGTLTGKAYYHTMRELTEEDPNLDSEEVRVEDATLVSSLNSLNTLRRVYNYYRNAEEVSYDIVSNGSFKCGDLINFTDPFGDEKSGYVKEMDETVSSIIKSRTKIATNWKPKFLGNTYQHSMIVKASDIINGVWTVPSAMRGNPALVVLFGGFGGGQGGYDGADGEHTNYDIYSRGWSSYIPSAGAGGEAGASGAYPKYIIGEYESLEASYSVSFGAGGEGGSVNGGEGAEGGHSTFGSYDTDNGERLTGQYINLIDGTVVASKGEDGFNGGNGGTTFSDNNKGARIDTVEETTSTAHYEWSRYNKIGGNGTSLGTFQGGRGNYGGSNYYERTSGSEREYFYDGAGCGGGGAAYGANGDDAFCNYLSRNGDANRGGNGANAIAPADAALGRTGSGGNGGGGGGAGSINFCYATSVGTNFLIHDPGAGGTGSVGGKGSDGFALVYY